MARPFKCPECKSTKSIWRGSRRLADGKVRLRECKACGRRFTTRRKTSEDRGDAG